MISLDLGSCRADILPVVNGLVSEADRVRAAYGKYEAYGASLGLEELEAVRRRSEIPPENMEASEIDIVYAKKMSRFGDVVIPSPAFCELVDLCAKDGKAVIPLDMDAYDFDTAYLKCIKAYEFTSEHHVAKKAMKRDFRECQTPEDLAVAWDRQISRGGFIKLNAMRERRIADEILDTAKYRRSLLAVIEVERAGNVAKLLEDRR